MSKLDELKKDKKKLFFVVLIVLAVLTTFILGIYNALNQGQTETASNVNDIDNVVVPVDEEVINNPERNKNTSIRNNDFFSSDLGVVGNQDEETVEDKDSLDDVKMNSVVQPKKNVSPYSNYKDEMLNNKEPSKPKEEVMNNSVVEEPVDTRRRRTPSDGTLKKSNKKLFRAVIDNGNKVVRSGGYVNIRLAEKMIIDGMEVERNSILTGKANYSQERMEIIITAVRVGNEFKKVKWAVYDEDGINGIAIPESILNEMARDGADEALDAEGGSIEGNVPVLGKLKVNVKKRNKEASFVLNNGHRIYISKKQ